MRAATGAFVTLAILQFAGVVFLYRPLVDAIPAGQPLVPRAVGFALSTALLVALLDWVSRATQNSVKGAMTIAIAQLLLVDVDYVLSGERMVVAGAASAVVLLVSWGLTGLVHGRLLELRRMGAQ